MSSFGSAMEAMTLSDRLERDRVDVTNDMKNSMADLGEVSDSQEEDLFMVFKTEPGLPDNECLAEVGVRVKTIAGAVKIKVIFEERDVQHLYSLRHARLTVAGSALSRTAVLRIPRANHGYFEARVRKFRNSEGLTMMVYEPTEPVNERIKRNCVDLVAAVFNQ